MPCSSHYSLRNPSRSSGSASTPSSCSTCGRLSKMRVFFDAHMHYVCAMPQLWHFFATIVSSFARLRRDSSVAGSQSASRSGLAVYRALYTTYYLPWVVDARRDGARSKRRRQRTALLSPQWMPSGWPIHLPKRTRTSSGTTGYVSCTSHVHTYAGGRAVVPS